MATKEYQQVKNQLIEQKITQQVTVVSGATGHVTVTIPASRRAFLKGYGYSWYTANVYQLNAGTFRFPSRSDQEGSTSIPVIYGNPFPILSGEKIDLQIINNDTATHTYDVVFYVLATEVIQVNSVGGELILATGGTSGAGNAVYITDSSGTNSAGVSATLGVAVEPKSPVAVIAGSKDTTDANKIVMGVSTPCRKISFQADPSNADAVLIGSTSSQKVSLDGGQSVTLEISNLNLVYIKRSGSNNLTVNYIGS